MRKCPRCVRPLLAKPVAACEVDLCLKCEGIWFDHGELRRIVDADPDIPNSALALAWQGAAPGGEAPGQTDLTCPGCGRPLDRYFYAENSGILVDGCAKGCGVWVDDGEVRKLFGWLETPEGGASRGLLRALGRVLKSL